MKNQNSIQLIKDFTSERLKQSTQNKAIRLITRKTAHSFVISFISITFASAIGSLPQRRD